MSVLFVLLSAVNGQHVETRSTASHDGFPGHELYGERQAYLRYDPVAAGNGPTTCAARRPSRPPTMGEPSPLIGATSQGAGGEQAGRARAMGGEAWSLNWTTSSCGPTDRLG